MRLLFTIALLLTALPTWGVPRSWRSTTGNQSFRADFVSSDGVRVTLKRADNRIITFPISKLHRDDQAWVKQQRKPANSGSSGRQPVPKGAAFDTLEFGDNRKTVEEKLGKSTIVTANISETLFGRTGLNGVFKTKATIGGLHCFLYFDWSESGILREVTLQTQPVAQGQYNSLLKQNWAELIKLLNSLHGNPAQEAPYPDINDLQDGGLLGSHLWHTDEKHSVLLCTGQERDKFIVAVRITSVYIAPTFTPAPGTTTPGTSPSGFSPADFRP